MTNRGIRWYCLALVPCAVLAVSCSQQDVDQWNAFWAASQPASQPATQVGDEEPLDEMSRLRLQRDRLAATNRNLQQELDLLAASHRNLESRYESLQAQSRAQAGELEAQRTRLRRAMEAIEKNRQEWETQLAERQRRIDLLTNQVERLTRRLEQAASTRPTGR